MVPPVESAELRALSWRISIHALQYSLTISALYGSPPWSIFYRSGRKSDRRFCAGYGARDVASAGAQNFRFWVPHVISHPRRWPRAGRAGWLRAGQRIWTLAAGRPAQQPDRPLAPVVRRRELGRPRAGQVICPGVRSSAASAARHSSTGAGLSVHAAGCPRRVSQPGGTACSLPSSPVRAGRRALVRERDRAGGRLAHGWVWGWRSLRAWVVWVRV